MKKFYKIITTMVLALAMVMQFRMVPAQAANTVTVHVKNNLGWASVNIYTWGDDGELAKAWPGTTMKDEGNGWLTYTFENATKDLNLVFNVDANGDGKVEAQTADVKGVSSAKSEYWVTLDKGEGAANDLGASTAGKASITDQKPADYTAPSTGTETKATDSQEKVTTKASDANTATTVASQEKQTTKSNTTGTAKSTTAPKTGDTLPMATMCLIVAAGVTLTVAVKKNREY